MLKHVKKYIKILLAVFILMLSMPSVKAATARINASSTSVYVGDSVTITATYTAAAWNLTISGDGVATAKYADVTADAENATKTASVNLNASKAGTYTVKLTGDITDGTTGDTTNVNTSVTVTVMEKPVETAKPITTNEGNAEDAPALAPAQTPVIARTSTPKDISTEESSNDTNKKTTISNDTNQTNEQQNKTKQITQSNTEEVVEEVQEVLPFGISKLELYGINEKNEKSKIEFTPVFDIDTYEYKGKVESNINKIEILKDANNYDEYLEIIGLDEELKEGENVIILRMKKEDSNVEYKIIVEKEISKDTTEEKIEQEDNESKSIKKENSNKEVIKKENKVYTYLKQYGWWIGTTVVLMSVEAGVFIYVIKKKYIKKQENE